MSDEVNERSFGVVPFSIQKEGLSVLLVQQRSHAWHLPKGHAEPAETPLETAARELKEETNLDVDTWLSSQPFVERYTFYRGRRRINKEVQYFPAMVSGVLRFPADEILTGRWVVCSDFPASLTFPELKRLAEDVLRWVSFNQELFP